MILALFFHLLEHFVSIYIVYVCVFWKSRLTVSIFEALNQIWFHCFGVFSGTNWLLSSSDGGGWRPNSHFIAWHTSTTKSFCTWWNLFCLKNLDRMLLHASFSLSTFEVKLITSFIWFVHWTKKHIPTSLPETDKEKLACQSSS